MGANKEITLLDFLAGTEVVGVALDAEEDAVGFVSAMTIIFLNLFLIKYKKFLDYNSKEKIY